MKKYLLLLSLGVTLGLGLAVRPVFVVAAADQTQQEIDELNKKIKAQNEKIKELQSSIETYKKNIVQKQTEAASLKNQLSILDNRVAQAQVDIELTGEKIDQTQLEIKALGLSIKAKQGVIDKQKKLVKKLVQNIKHNQDKNYLEIFLTEKTFADFFAAVRSEESVYTDLGHSVKMLRLAKEELDAKKKQVQERELAYQDLKTQLEQKKQDLSEQALAKENLLVSTRSSEFRYTTLVESLRKQYQSTENEIESYEAQVRKKLAEQKGNQPEVAGPNGDVVLSWPLVNRYITARFHDPGYPFRNVFEHSAIDIRAAQGTSVMAAGSGYVGQAKRCAASTCYSYILIVHTSTLSTVYGHMSSLNVKIGDFVNRGDVIGLSGGTPGTVGAGPFVTGPHLHFEVRKNGIPTDPLGYLGN